jgi:hypothetical protein
MPRLIPLSRAQTHTYLQLRARMPWRMSRNRARICRRQWTIGSTSATYAREKPRNGRRFQSEPTNAKPPPVEPDWYERRASIYQEHARSRSRREFSQPKERHGLLEISCVDKLRNMPGPIPTFDSSAETEVDIKESMTPSTALIDSDRLRVIVPLGSEQLNMENA